VLLAHSQVDASLWTAWFTDRGPAVAILALAAGYGIGVRRLWHTAGTGRGITRRQSQCFAVAIAALAVGLLSPLDALAEELFAAHMVQHILLAVIIPPFLVLAAPELALFWAFPRGARHRLGRASHRFGRARAFWRVLTLPLVACTLHAAALWLWHAPRLYDFALDDGAIHALEHVSLLGTGMLLWWRIIHPVTDRRNAYGIGILTLFVTAMQTGALGALLTLSTRVLYPAQAAGAAAWGLTPLGDQQLAGLLMWVVGGLLYVVAMSVLFAAWLSPGARRRTGRALVAASAVAAGGCQRAAATPVPGGDAQRGKTAIAAMGCGACHVIGGLSLAHGEVGPPLNGVARRAIIGGALPNTPDNMMLWIEDPPAISPTTAMPNLGVTPQAARDIVAYLYTLK
jgi:putative membrane protein